MNEQKAPSGIEWTRVILPDGTRTRGFTWNVFGGCKHACEWQMPDGTVAGCYAKLVAERVAQEHYPQGFEAHYFHPKRLVEPSRQKQPVGIFLDSMADAMGHWVDAGEIEQVLDVCRSTPQHTYFLLTKNAPRLLEFEFPDNVWTGVSSPPDWMFGKRLTRKQQEAMLHRTMKVLSQVKSKVRWISFEPLSWDCSDIIAEYPGALQWAVVGGASNGPREFPPSLTDLVRLLTVLDDQNVPTFYKGNLHTLPWASAHWREDFPTSPTRAAKLIDSTGKTQAECLELARENQTRAFEITAVDEELSGMYAVYAAYWYDAAAKLRPARPLPPLREFAMMTPDGLVRGTVEELEALRAGSDERISDLIADLPAVVDVAPIAPKPAVTWDNLTEPTPVTTVANFQDVKAHWDRTKRQWDDPKFVYIGRYSPAHNLPGHLLANPFKIAADTPEARTKALEQYRAMLTERLADPIDGPKYRAALDSLRGKTCVCWCAPKKCHGDILREFLGETVEAHHEHAEPPQPEQPSVQMSLFGDELPAKKKVYA